MKRRAEENGTGRERKRTMSSNTELEELLKEIKDEEDGRYTFSYDSEIDDPMRVDDPGEDKTRRPTADCEPESKERNEPMPYIKPLNSPDKTIEKIEDKTCRPPGDLEPQSHDSSKSPHSNMSSITPDRTPKKQEDKTSRLVDGQEYGSINSNKHLHIPDITPKKLKDKTPSHEGTQTKHGKQPKGKSYTIPLINGKKNRETTSKISSLNTQSTSKKPPTTSNKGKYKDALKIPDHAMHKASVEDSMIDIEEPSCASSPIAGEPDTTSPRNLLSTSDKGKHKAIKVVANPEAEERTTDTQMDLEDTTGDPTGTQISYNVYVFRKDLRILTQNEFQDLEDKLLDQQMEDNVAIKIELTRRSTYRRAIQMRVYVKQDAEKIIAVIKKIQQENSHINWYCAGLESGVSNRVILRLPHRYMRYVVAGTLFQLISLSTPQQDAATNMQLNVPVKILEDKRIVVIIDLSEKFYAYCEKRKFTLNYLGRRFFLNPTRGMSLSGDLSRLHIKDSK